MPFFQAILLPNNQPEIHLGYFKAKSRYDAIRKARKQNSQLCREDIVCARKVEKSEIGRRIDQLFNEKARIVDEYSKLLELIRE